MKQSPLFSKTHDFLLWLIPLTLRFPRQQRFVLAAALQRDTLRFQELIIEAVHTQRAHDKLDQADAELDKLRAHMRLSRELELISPGQYEHAARMLTEMGRLVGGWKKALVQISN
jgi:hypothetical protein